MAPQCGTTTEVGITTNLWSACGIAPWPREPLPKGGGSQSRRKPASCIPRDWWMVTSSQLRGARGSPVCMIPLSPWRERLVNAMVCLPRKEQVRRLKVSCEAWAAIALACVAVRQRRFSTESREERRRLATLQALARWVVTATMGRGPWETMATIKSWCTGIRRQAFEKSKVSDFWFRGAVGALVPPWEMELRLQFSMVGRALPAGDGRVVAAALESHRAELGAKGSSPPDVVEGAAAFSEDWARSYGLNLTLAGPPPVQSSACLEYSLREGGVPRAISELLKGTPLLPPSAVLHGMAETSASSRPERRIASAIRSLGASATRGRVIGLAERGWKSRVVTCHAASVVAFLHYWGNALRSALARHPRISAVLAGDHRGAVEKLFRSGLDPTAVILSADLTAATDTFHRDLVEALMKGLIRAVGLTGEFAELSLRLATGEYTLQYPDGSTVQTQRGILMGLPTTWPLLCLANLFWLDWAESLAIRKRPLLPRLPVGTAGTGLPPRPRVIPRSRKEAAAICGDDLLAVVRPEVADLYEDRARVCGARFSKGKHLRSARYGIFTEEIFSVKYSVVRGEKLALVSCSSPTGYAKAVLSGLPSRPIGKKLALVTRPVRVFMAFRSWAHCVPLKWAVRCQSWDRAGPGAANRVPDWYAVGPAAMSIAAAHPRRLGMVGRIQRAARPGLASWFASHGIPPYLPRTLGGGGMLPKSWPRTTMGEVASRLWRDGISSMIYRSQEPDRLARIWQLARSPAFAEADRVVVSGLASRVTRSAAHGPPMGGLDVRTPARESMDRRVGQGVLWAVRKGFPLTRSSGLLNPSGLCRSLKRALLRALRQKGGFGQSRSSAPVAAVLKRAASVGDPRLLWESSSIRLMQAFKGRSYRAVRREGDHVGGFGLPRRKPGAKAPGWVVMRSDPTCTS
nr:MAG: putative RNA-dependent RNA polymerase [Narnaviridae sp.]